MEEYDHLHEAKTLVKNTNYGILSTISSSLEGYPFGSLTPFIQDQNGRFIILISDIAEHTKNIKSNPKVCLTILDGNNTKNIQTKGRLTYIGNAIQLPDEHFEVIKAMYNEKFPGSAQYFKIHGFSFYRLELERIRFIGGFGKIFWIEKQEFLED